MRRFKVGDVVKRIAKPSEREGSPEKGSVGVVISIEDEDDPYEIEVRFFDGNVWNCNVSSLKKIKVKNEKDLS